MSRYDYYQWERQRDGRANRRRDEKENSFYTRPNSDGIIEQQKQELPDIPTIKNDIKAAEKHAEDMVKERWSTVTSGATGDEIMAANQNVENANEHVKKLNLQLTAAYGLGEDGYWNNQRTTPAATEKSRQMRSNPEHAYATGNSSTANAGRARPATAQPKTTAATKPRATQYDMDIALLQDELVNNHDMNDYKKGQINDKLKTLNAKRNVLNWKATQSRKPTVEDYDAQQSYLDREIQFAQDDMVNALGSGKVEVGDEAWYKYHDKVNELAEQRDAYNMGRMGQLDGERAVAASEQVSSGGGTRSVSLAANNDDVMYVGLNDDENSQTPKEPDEDKPEPSQTDIDELVNSYEDTDYEPEEVPLSEEELKVINKQIQADIDYNNEITSKDHYFDEEIIANADLSELRGWQIGKRKQMNIDETMQEIDKQMAEEIAIFDNLKQVTYQDAYKFYDEHQDQMPAMMGQISAELNISYEDLKSYTNAELKQAFAESSWRLDGASKIEREDYIKNLTPKYDGLRDEAIATINDEFKPYEQMDELGLSDLWEIEGMIEESEVKDLIKVVLDIPNNKQLKEPVVATKEFSITSSYDRDIHYIENVMLPKIKEKDRVSASKEIAGLIEDAASAQVPMGDIITVATRLLSKYSSRAPIKFNHAESIELGSYREYEVSYFDSSFNGKISIFVEINEAGNIKEPPHLYAYKTGNKPGTSGIEDDLGFYQIGGLYQNYNSN